MPTLTLEAHAIGMQTLIIAVLERRPYSVCKSSKAKRLLYIYKGEAAVGYWLDASLSRYKSERARGTGAGPQWVIYFADLWRISEVVGWFTRGPGSRGPRVAERRDTHAENKLVRLWCSGQWSMDEDLKSSYLIWEVSKNESTVLWFTNNYWIRAFQW